MYLAYSAINNNDNTIFGDSGKDGAETELSIRYRAYQNTCEKFRKEIAAIQNYLPGWTPEFTY